MEDAKILLLHGTAGDKTLWRKVVSNNPSFIPLTLEGFGERATSKKLNLDIWASDVEDKAKGKGKVVLVGFSLGGFIALRCLERELLDIERLIIISTPFDGRFMRNSWKKIISFFYTNEVGQETLQNLVGGGQQFLRKLPSSIKAGEFEESLGYLRKGEVMLDKATVLATLSGLYEISNTGFSEVLKRNKVPITAMFGTEDALFSDNYISEWKKFPNCDVIQIHKAGHYIPLTHPEEIIKAIKCYTSSRHP